MMAGFNLSMEIYGHNNTPLQFQPGQAYHNGTDIESACPNISDSQETEWTTYAIYKVIIDVFFVGTLCIIGFIGNALSIIILHRDQDRKNANTTNWLLQTLALVDTLYLIACIFIQPIKTIHQFTNWIPSLKWAFPYMYPYVWVGASIAQTITVWMVMLVTIDRYIAICHPLKTQLRSVERAKVAVLLIVIASICYNIPRIFEREITKKVDDCLNTTTVISGKTKLWDNKIYFLVYKTILYFIFRAIGPLLVLIILNVRLIRALHVVRKKHKDLTSKSNRKSENITLMLIAVVSVFILCVIPDLTLRVILTLMNYTAMSLDILSLRYANAITNMLLTVNSSINFLIYCLIGKKFRKILYEMVCSAKFRNRRAKKRTGDVSETEPLTNRSTYTALNSPGGGGQNGRGTENNQNGKVIDADVRL